MNAYMYCMVWLLITIKYIVCLLILYNDVLQHKSLQTSQWPNSFKTSQNTQFRSSYVHVHVHIGGFVCQQIMLICQQLLLGIWWITHCPHQQVESSNLWTIIAEILNSHVLPTNLIHGTAWSLGSWRWTVTKRRRASVSLDHHSGYVISCDNILWHTVQGLFTSNCCGGFKNSRFLFAGAVLKIDFYSWQ